MAKISLSQKDVQNALKDVVKEELAKEKDASNRKMLEQAKKVDYGGNCPYCQKLVSLESKKGRWEIIKNKNYLVGDCSLCKKEIWCMIYTQSSSGSMFANETVVGVFRKKEDVIKDPPAMALPVQTATKQKPAVNHMPVGNVKIYNIERYEEAMRETRNT